MILSYPCVWCGKVYAVSDDCSGKKVRCKACGQIQRLPGARRLPAGLDHPSSGGGYALVPESPSRLERAEPVTLGFRSAPGGGAVRGKRERAEGGRAGTLLGRVDVMGMLIKVWRWPVRLGTGSASRVEQESLALLFLSIADLLVTHALLRSGPAYYESNPVAHWFFARWNIAGMTVLKFSVVGFVVLIGEVVEHRRPGLGKGMLTVASLLTAGVVAYGLKLLFGSGMV